MTTYENLLNDTIADFKAYSEVTLKDQRDPDDMKARVIRLHLYHAEGRMEGIRKAFLEVKVDSMEDIDFYFDQYDDYMEELRKVYERLIERIRP